VAKLEKSKSVGSWALVLGKAAPGARLEFEFFLYTNALSEEKNIKHMI
jgi:hypothetical protein